MYGKKVHGTIIDRMFFAGVCGSTDGNFYALVAGNFSCTGYTGQSFGTGTLSGDRKLGG